jgi:hypothetical protein
VDQQPSNPKDKPDGPKVIEGIRRNPAPIPSASGSAGDQQPGVLLGGRRDRGGDASGRPASGSVSGENRSKGQERPSAPTFSGRRKSQPVEDNAFGPQPKPSGETAKPSHAIKTDDRPTMDEVRKRFSDHGSREGFPKESKGNLGGRPNETPRERLDAGKFHPSMKLTTPEKSSLRPGNMGVTTSGRARFAERYKSGELKEVTKGDVAKKLQLDEQYRLYQKGDVARQLGLNKRMMEDAASHGDLHGKMGRLEPKMSPQRAVDMRDHRKDFDRHDGHFAHHFPYYGRINIDFNRHYFNYRYYGPSYYPTTCWYPRWNPWVAWSWHYHCHPLWDPRPIWCRPVVYVVAPAWVYWEVPVWTPLPMATCGTWVDVPPAVAVPKQYDLQLLAVRFVDPGHPEEKLGPRYRVWFRNNSDQPITQPFNVTLMASTDNRLAAGLPQAGVRVTAIEAGDTQSVDIRLPVEVGTMGRDAQGNPAPFSTLHVLVDANREINETTKANNGLQIAQGEILPVDPAVFEVQPKTAAPGADVLLAGEGLGPEPGQVLIHLGGIEMQAEILGWYDLGVQLKLPNLPLAGPTPAELVVVRGDGAAANPLTVTISPDAQNVEGPALGPAIQPQ